MTKLMWRLSMKMTVLIMVVGVFAPCGVLAQTSYSTSFEDFILGPMSVDGSTCQGGWSGGAQGGFTNNTSEPGSVHDEFITTDDAYSGAQSWRFERGYDSPGQGTPFTPELGVTCGQPSSGADFNGFVASIWFKAVDPLGDDSRVSIIAGNPAGNDRASNYLEIDNGAGAGITIRTYDGVEGGGWGSAELLVATGLDATQWHHLEMVANFIDGPFNDTWTYVVDGGAPVVGGAYFETARDNFGYGYELTNRLKFQPRHLDGNADPNVSPYFAGFYFDDVSYEAMADPVSNEDATWGEVKNLYR